MRVFLFSIFCANLPQPLGETMTQPTRLADPPASVTRQTTLPTQVFATFYKHPPDGLLKGHPYPRLAPERIPMTGSVVLAVQTGFTNAVYIAFNKADARRVVAYDGVIVRLGDPHCQEMPEVSLREVIMLPAPYADFFKRLNNASAKLKNGHGGITFLDHLPAGVWATFTPNKANQPYGIMNVTNGQGQNRVIFFPSKHTGMKILANWDDLYHGDAPKEIAQSTLPEESKLDLVELSGSVADWIIAFDFLSRP